MAREPHARKRVAILGGGMAGPRGGMVAQRRPKLVTSSR